MKDLNPVFFIIFIIPVLTLQIFSQTTYNPSYDSQKEWLTDYGVADGIASANYQSGAVAAFVGAWAGVSASEGGVKVYLPTDISDNTLIKVIAKVKFINATINYGFGSFAGTRIVYGGNNQYKSKDIEFGLSWENIYDKVEQIASLATGYGGISASLTLPSKVKKAVKYVKKIFYIKNLRCSWFGTAASESKWKYRNSIIHI